ncbi:MAG: acyl-CoA dehydrogenase, partial [Deltaproteobacteria bacterium]
MKNVIEAIEALYARALDEVRERVLEGDRPSGRKLNEAQLAGHGLAYLATELEACRQLSAWADRVGGDQATGIAKAYVAEVARTLAGGIDLGPCENVSLGELGLTDEDVAKTIRREQVLTFIAEHGGGDAYLDIARRARDDGQPNRGMGDPMLDEVQKQFAKFVDAEVLPLAQDIHRKDELIPMKLVTQMSELGVFGLTIPEEYDGLGMSKVAMCVVTEELSRGYIGVGSLGTRAEIAAELIMGG